MRESPYDIRPALISLFYAGEDQYLLPVLEFGVAYLRTWVGRRGMDFEDAVIKAAAADGLLKLYLPAQCMPTDQRASQLRIRASRYRLLKGVANDAYRQRLVEGAMRFTAAAANSEDPLTAGTVLSPWAESTWWNKVEAGRRPNAKLLKLEVGNRDRPPAFDPRAPSRDTGWLPNYDWAA
jgi:hypothetical protein